MYTNFMERIHQVTEQYPLSFEDCADILENTAPLAGALTKDGLLKLLDNYTTQLQGENG